MNCKQHETERPLAGLITVPSVSLSCFAAVALLGCATAPPAVTASAPRSPTPTKIAPAPTPIPDPIPAKRLLAIDWDRVPAANDAEALALWRTIAPTGADWEAKVDEIPSDKPVARALAIALLHEGNFSCKGAAPTCARQPFDVDGPRPDSTIAEPCLRRLLALWAIDQLEDADLGTVKDALHAIVMIPPPESQLVAAALHQFPESDQDGRLHVMTLAWGAGQRDLVNGTIGTLDEAHLITAARKYHIDGAVEVLSAEAHRAVYLAAVTDELMPTRRRTQAIIDLAVLDDKLPTDVRTAFVTAAKSADCTVAATAGRALDQRGDHRFVPRRTRTRSEAAMMRSLCVLASYEQLQRNDEDSLMPTYVGATGLEQVKVTYDALGETDDDGDGDPHTEHTSIRVARADVVLPEVDDLVRAMQHCTGTVCSSDDRDYRFGFKAVAGELLLTRLEVVERPSCPTKP